MRFLKNRSTKFVAAGMATALMALVFSSASFAASHNPTGEYKQFNECPLNRVTINDCVFSVTAGGSFTIGKKTVPIVNPVTLQGGYEGGGSEIQFYGAENGNTLSKSPQPVPGGLLGITAPTWWPKFVQDWFNNLISKGFTGVNATVELTGPTKGLTNIKLSTENLILGSGVALGLPAKIKLDNAILGSNCYIGSSSKPVNINTTSGKSGKLTGAVGSITFNPDFTITTISGGRLVDNTFTAPAASGCGGIFSLFIDPLVNSILGTPAGAGVNSAILEGKIQDAVAESVRESE